METDQIVVRSLKAAGLKGVTVELELREQCASVRGQAEPDGGAQRCVIFSLSWEPFSIPWIRRANSVACELA